MRKRRTASGSKWEDEALGKEEDFAATLARGFARIVAFLGANQLAVTAIENRLLCHHIEIDGAAAQP